ncbi:hypothetical protein M426DRAFT_8650 [Hypoxylon sp. CI-4A]|nr:hypothetical protein M426DRAFT_8650 [Hypoxylon sp. CI-4A]
MASFTFGSFGDIITTCQLALELGRALSSARGSANEYQSLRKDLDAFVDTLVHVVGTYQQYEESRRLKDLRDTTKSIVDESRALLQESLDAWNRQYDKSLRAAGSGNPFKDAYKKLKWVSEKNSVVALQNKLKSNTSRLTLLTILTSHHSARADNTTLIHRINEVEEAAKSHKSQVLEAIKSQNKTLVMMEEQMARQHATTGTVLTTVNTTFQSIIRIEEMIEEMNKFVIDQRYKMTDSKFFAAPDPTLGRDVILEDALGNVIPINHGLVHSWKFFEELVAHQFEGSKGHDMVVKRQYALEEGCSGNDIDRSIP